MMVDLVKRITQSDVHEKLQGKLKNFKKGYSSKSKLCMACQGSIVDYSISMENVVVFR